MNLYFIHLLFTEYKIRKISQPRLTLSYFINCTYSNMSIVYRFTIKVVTLDYRLSTLTFYVCHNS